MPNVLNRCISIILYSALLLPLFIAPSFASNTINVLAPKSMTIVLSQLARDYATKEQAVVNSSFVIPRLQAEHITDGGAADLLITSDIKWLTDLQQQGLYDIYSKTNIAKNRLVLVGPLDTPLDIDLLQGFPVDQIIREISFDKGFVVGNPQTLPEGAYAKNALRTMQALDYLEEFMLFPRYLDQMYDLITSRNAYGVFFESTTAHRKGVKVMSAFPEGSYEPIDYYAVVIAGDNMDEARKMLAYLQTKTAQRILQSNGFSLPIVQ